MNGTTLTELGWNATEDRTDPPTREADVEAWINRGATVFKLKGEKDGEVIQMEDAWSVEP